MHTLRPYQLEAVDALLAGLRSGRNPAAQLPTGTGKSLVIAELVRRLAARGGRVWVMAHVAELVAQNSATYRAHTGHPPGLICAGLGRQDLDTQVTFCSVQSMIGPLRAGRLAAPHLIIVDEVHRVPHNNGDSSQYAQVFDLAPEARRIGLSATPWRLDNGLIYGQGGRFWFDSLDYAYTVPQAVSDGWLCPLVGVESTVQLNLPEPPAGADYVAVQVSELQGLEWLQEALFSATQLAQQRRHCAVYCPSVAVAMRAVNALTLHGQAARLLTGGMSPAERADTLADWRAGRFKWLCSVDILTTGFDFPALDCITCLRPTVSSSLWVQIMGRGTRLHPDKKNCLLLDYVGNLQRLGGVSMLETYVRQAAPLEPLEALPAAPREPRRVLPGVRTLAVLDPTSGEHAREGATLTVQVNAVNCVALPTRRNPQEPVLLVNYACTTAEGARLDASAFITTATDNEQARRFFLDRRLAVHLPSEARKVMWQVKGSALPRAVVVRKQGRYWNVQAELWGLFWGL